MDDPVLTYFAENLSTVSKEELLQALENALGSASYWRDACLLGCLSNQRRSDSLRSGHVIDSSGPQSNSH